MHLSANILDEIRDLYERGLYLQAYERACSQAPLKGWRGADARILAAQIVRQLGANRLAEVLLWCARRENPYHLEAQFFATLDVLGRRGWYSAWKLVWKEVPASTPSALADWYALRARLFAIVRDFDSAHQWLDRALMSDPDSSWIAVEKAAILALEDRRSEALAIGEHVLSRQPSYRPALLQVAELLAESGRQQDAIELLGLTAPQLESGAVWGELAQLQMELGQYREALHSLEQAEMCLLLIEPQQRRWLLAMRSDLYYFLGERNQAIITAHSVGTAHYTAFAERLEQPTPGNRRLLPVGFVRQHHSTCAPATLASLCAYWSMSAEHLEVAAEICYDGTPAHSERAWAERNGWWVREFRVDWTSTCALIDAGIPFTLQTVEPTSAHLQAVIGYDACRRTLIVRDPSCRTSEEYNADSFLERYRPYGPRGMVMLPMERAGLVAHLDLPENRLYDGLYQLQCHLEKHDREAALETLAWMVNEDLDHRLVLIAQCRIAAYDEDLPALNNCYERSLKLFPNCATLKMARISYMKDFSKRSERIALLEEACKESYIHPIFPTMLARELCADDRERNRALALARQAMDGGPSAHALAVYAELLSKGREDAEACLYQRLCAHFEYRTERHAWKYFELARLAGRPEEALTFLMQRFEKLGGQSGDPACTLFSALQTLGQAEEGFEVLEVALQKRPEDGSLAVIAAEKYLSYFRLSRSRELLNRSRGYCRKADWLAAAAQLAQEEGNPQEALAFWREAIELNPLDRAAHSQFTRLLAMVEGIPAALEYLEAVASQFPFHRGLLGLCYDWFVAEAPDRALSLLEQMVESEPADSWAQRELALRLAIHGHWEEAARRIEAALLVEPASSASHRLYGWLRERSGDNLGAWQEYAQALRLDVDQSGAISSLVGVCEDPQERRTTIELVWQELEKQVIFGDGVFAFREEASGILAPEELLERMRIICSERPDLWQSWSALVDQLVEMGKVEEALLTAQQACGRFKLVAQLRLDLERVLKFMGDALGRIAVLEEALVLMPGDEDLVKALAAAYEDQGDLKRSAALLEPAVKQAPLNATFHGYYADTLWHLGQGEKALEHIAQAVRLKPTYDWAWSRLRQWSTNLNQPERLSEALQALTERRPGEARSWLLVAEHLKGEEYLEQCLQALDRAITIDPRNSRGHDLRSTLLADLGRYEEALAACKPTVYGDAPPQNLLGRAAWVEAQRYELAKAIDAMEFALALNVDYYWGWARLADWYEQTEDAQASLHAAQQMVRLEPNEDVALGYLADALLRLGERDQAKSALLHALRVSPQYRWGARTLFNLQLEDNDFEGAAETLAQLRRQKQDPEAIAFSVRLAARTGDRHLAFTEFTHLLEEEKNDSYSLRTACWAMLRAGFTKEMFSQLDQAIQLDTHPYAAECKIRFLLDKGLWDDCLDLLNSLPTDSRSWHNACVEFLRTASRRHCRGLLFWIESKRELLVEDDVRWGMVGYVLVVAYRYRETVEWHANWKDRQDIQGWMLLNLAVALRGIGHFAEALVVHHEALRRFPDNKNHRLWLAYDSVFAGDFDAADLVVRAMRRDSLNTYYSFLLQLVRSVLNICTAKDSDSKLVEASQILRDAVGSYPSLPRNPLLRRAYRRCVRFMLNRCRQPHLSLHLALGLLARHRKQRNPRWPAGRALRLRAIAQVKVGDDQCRESIEPH